MVTRSHDDIDSGRSFDWGRTSQDYDRFRPGPPDSFYAKLAAFEIGLPDQALLDIGTGTGLLARRFAERRCRVSGIDISTDQLNMARVAAEREGLTIDFKQAPAESIPYEDASFNVVTANQCWIYFDTSRVVPEISRVLKPDGKLVVSHFSFMPRLDEIVAASEALVLKYNPDWTGADWDGYIKPEPAWSKGFLDLIGFFVYDERVPFTRESWRGRMRALRGIAASLDAEEVARFDREHDALLQDIAGETFDVWHRIHAQILAPKPTSTT